MNIAILGGTFNPPHKGHIKMAMLALGLKGIDQVWFMPCYVHQYKHNIASPEDRYEMCFRATKGTSIMVSRFEIDNECQGSTYENIQNLQQEFPNNKLFLVIGQDCADTIDNWKYSKELREEFKFIVINRMGYKPGYKSKTKTDVWYKKNGHQYIGGKTRSTSSTMIRDYIADNRWTMAVKHLPCGVADYIKAKDLYKEKM